MQNTTSERIAPAMVLGYARCLLIGLAASFLTATFHGQAAASFQAFTGGLAAEANWRAAAGETHLEDFESFSNGQQIPALPGLGVAFDELAGGGYPQAYLFGGTPYGPMHLGNFPNGINATNRWNDIVMRPQPGLVLHAVGFWNGDGQADTYFARAYTADGQLIGSVGAFKDTFAGFITDLEVARVVFDGNTGDGWNHLDGLQTAVATVAEPPVLQLFLSGSLAMLWLRRFKCSA